MNNFLEGMESLSLNTLMLSNPVTHALEEMTKFIRNVSPSSILNSVLQLPVTLSGQLWDFIYFLLLRDEENSAKSLLRSPAQERGYSFPLFYTPKSPLTPFTQDCFFTVLTLLPQCIKFSAGLENFRTDGRSLLILKSDCHVRTPFGQPCQKSKQGHIIMQDPEHSVMYCVCHNTHHAYAVQNLATSFEIVYMYFTTLKVFL